MDGRRSRNVVKFPGLPDTRRRGNNNNQQADLLMKLPIEVLTHIVTLRDAVRLMSVCKALRFGLMDVLMRWKSNNLIGICREGSQLPPYALNVVIMRDCVPTFDRDVLHAERTSNLRRLVLVNPPIHQLQSTTSLTQLTSLCVLCANTGLPDGIGTLTNITHLWCENLGKLPDGISALTALRGMSLTTCKSLTKLPDGISALTQLTKLKLDRCKGLTVLPDGISALTDLRELSLSTCKSLTKLPDGISALIQLTKLDLEHCEGLTELPSGASVIAGAIRNLPAGLEIRY